MREGEQLLHAGDRSGGQLLADVGRAILLLAAHVPERLRVGEREGRRSLRIPIWWPTRFQTWT